MRRLSQRLALPLLLTVLTGCSLYRTNYSLQIQNMTPDEYRQVLVEFDKSDQRYRKAISWGTTDPVELARLEALDDEAHMAEWVRRNQENISLSPEVEEDLWKKQIAIDRINTNALMALVRTNGWPTKEYLGEGFADPVPVLIHMQPEDAEWVLPILRDEVNAGRMEPKTYAMIYDRKLQHNGEPQLFGLMRAFDSKTNSVLPPAIEDIGTTNKARREIGMEPLEEYRITDAKTASGQ